MLLQCSYMLFLVSMKKKMHTRYLETPPIFLVLTLLLATASHGATWTYTGPDGEQHWPKQYPFCGGIFQSPIDLHTHLFRYDPTLAPVKVWNYDLSIQEQLSLGNNGHSVQLSLPPSMHLSVGLAHRYSAAQLHLHWGSPSMPAGSEHTVNGKQFAAEMHIVHFNSDKYPNVSTAAYKSDGLAVLGVLIEVGKFNPGFDLFLKYLSSIRYKDQKIQVPAFNIRNLLPARLDEFYRYDGSLTTPPCYPSVLWTVFRTPITISHGQFQDLASTLYSSSVQDSILTTLNGNYRRPKRPDDRVVLVSFQDGRLLHAPLTVASPPEAAEPRANQHQEPAQPRPDQEQTPEAGWKVPASRGMRAPFPHWNSPRAPVLLEDELCYVALERNARRQLRRNHGGGLVEALRDTVFPELNLRSYLACRSNLALPTMRHILRTRPSDEANELDQSLTRAITTPRKSYPTNRGGHTQSTMQNQIQYRAKARWHHGPLHEEWED
ncbi:hypothetical protein AAFF_G00223560 [Aldrovandia affinis]|uniref:Carbonic anhydrase n=1 Tax=Aldrovandia affinis TaxID=143900 RepID=A0AAD7TBX6_9TELE|nr:hypothetical protein AAFF_G00223560 [Aldrovandia affinis]